MVEVVEDGAVADDPPVDDDRNWRTASRIRVTKGILPAEIKNSPAVHVDVAGRGAVIVKGSVSVKIQNSGIHHGIPGEGIVLAEGGPIASVEVQPA